MIWYDSHQTCTLLVLRGSVIPKSMLWAVPAGIIAGILRYLVVMGYLDMDQMANLSQGNIYSGFTFVLGFSLVFRTSQAYARYWTAATAVHQMSNEWSDSCSSLIAFSTVSRALEVEVIRFQHTVVRLYSLLHAMALSEVASVSSSLPLVDIQGLNKDRLGVLATEEANGKRVQICLAWIKAFTLQKASQGILDVPAPILTRVFQELGNGLGHFHRAQEIVIWPFPFPYTQLNWFLLQIYTIITPVILSSWDTFPWVCSVFTIVSVTCLVSLDLVACELENPFGEDPNDLPVVDMQIELNKFLSMLINPNVIQPPDLLRTAVLDFEELESHSRVHNKTPVWRGEVSKKSSSKAASANELEVKSLQEWLQTDKRAYHDFCGMKSSSSIDIGSAENQVKVTESVAVFRRFGVEDKQPDFGNFLEGLSEKLSEHLQNQLAVQRKELRVIENMVGRWEGLSPAAMDAQQAQNAGDFATLSEADQPPCQEPIEPPGRESGSTDSGPLLPHLEYSSELSEEPMQPWAPTAPPHSSKPGLLQRAGGVNADLSRVVGGTTCQWV